MFSIILRNVKGGLVFSTKNAGFIWFIKEILKEMHIERDPSGRFSSILLK